MRRSSLILTIALSVVAILVATICYFQSLTYVRGAEERPWDLWIAALKGFSGDVYYVGSDEQFSYFRSATLLGYSRYKRQTSKTQLPRTFPPGEREPYRVTFQMVPQYP